MNDGQKGDKAAAVAANTLSNLLHAGKQVSLDLPGSSKGFILGEGLPPVSQKLAEKIGKGEFVEMHELLPQEWISTEKDGELSQVSRRHKFLDVRVWALCFIPVGLQTY